MAPYLASFIFLARHQTPWANQRCHFLMPVLCCTCRCRRTSPLVSLGSSNWRPICTPPHWPSLCVCSCISWRATFFFLPASTGCCCYVYMCLRYVVCAGSFVCYKELQESPGDVPHVFLLCFSSECSMCSSLRNSVGLSICFWRKRSMCDANRCVVRLFVSCTRMKSNIQ